LERGGAHTAGALCIRAIVLTWRVDLLVSDCECFLFFECFDEYEQKLVDTQKFVEYCKTILMSTTLSCLQFTFTSHAHAYASVGFAPVYKHSVGDRLKLTIGFVFSFFFLTFPLFFVSSRRLSASFWVHVNYTTIIIIIIIFVFICGRQTATNT